MTCKCCKYDDEADEAEKYKYLVGIRSETREITEDNPNMKYFLVDPIDAATCFSGLDVSFLLRELAIQTQEKMYWKKKHDDLSSEALAMAQQGSVNVLKAALAGTQLGKPKEERDPWIDKFCTDKSDAAT